ncbi:PD-(D/E)XK motif protein [Spiroplasma endosymbiont of Thecophora atra]
MYFFKIKFNISIIEFWHSNFNNLFDFEFRYNLILEVKSTTNSSRIHSFNHEQIFSTQETKKVISSVILSKRDKGLSLYDFSLQLKEIFNDYEFACKVDTLFFKFGISEFKKGPCIDLEKTMLNIKIYDSHFIPQFQEIPSGIKNLKYDVNLEKIQYLTENTVFSIFNN